MPRFGVISNYLHHIRLQQHPLKDQSPAAAVALGIPQSVAYGSELMHV